MNAIEALIKAAEEEATRLRDAGFTAGSALAYQARIERWERLASEARAELAKLK